MPRARPSLRRLACTEVREGRVGVGSLVPLWAPSRAARRAARWDHGPRTPRASRWGSCCPKWAPCLGTTPRSAETLLGFFSFSCCSLCHKSDFPPMLLTGPVSGKRRTHGGVKTRTPALTECKLVMFISSYQLFNRNTGIGGKHSPLSVSASSDTSTPRCWYSARPPPRLLRPLRPVIGLIGSFLREQMTHLSSIGNKWFKVI